MTKGGKDKYLDSPKKNLCKFWWKCNSIVFNSNCIKRSSFISYSIRCPTSLKGEPTSCKKPIPLTKEKCKKLIISDSVLFINSFSCIVKIMQHKYPSVYALNYGQRPKMDVYNLEKLAKMALKLNILVKFTNTCYRL